MVETQPSAGQRLAAAEAASYATAMDGLAVRQELHERDLLTDRLYEAHIAGVLARLDPGLVVSRQQERRPLSEDLLHRRIVAQRVAERPWLLAAPSVGPQDGLPAELDSRGIVGLSEGAKVRDVLVRPEDLVRVIAELAGSPGSAPPRK